MVMPFDSVQEKSNLYLSPSFIQYVLDGEYKRVIVNSPFSAPLDKATVPRSWIRVMLKVAFRAGSSKQGKAFLASVGCIWVVATTLTGKRLVRFVIFSLNQHKDRNCLCCVSFLQNTPFGIEMLSKPLFLGPSCEFLNPLDSHWMLSDTLSSHTCAVRSPCTRSGRSLPGHQPALQWSRWTGSTVGPSEVYRPAAGPGTGSPAAATKTWSAGPWRGCWPRWASPTGHSQVWCSSVYWSGWESGLCPRRIETPRWSYLQQHEITCLDTQSQPSPLDWIKLHHMTQTHNVIITSRQTLSPSLFHLKEKPPHSCSFYFLKTDEDLI